jgi:DNA-binding MarR family transcriptional regulator
MRLGMRSPAKEARSRVQQEKKFSARQVVSLDREADAVEEASLALLEMTLTGVAAAGGVSTLQLRMLLIVDRHAPLNISSLAQRLHMSSPSASRLVDRAVEARLLTRNLAEHSRREVSLTLTAVGRRALTQLRRSRQRDIGDVLKNMSSDERRALVAGLRAFAAAADA